MCVLGCDDASVDLEDDFKYFSTILHTHAANAASIFMKAVQSLYSENRVSVSGNILKMMRESLSTWRRDRSLGGLSEQPVKLAAKRRNKRLL